MAITPLTGTSTFYNWYITTNDIIAELNSVSLYGATSGDGVKLETDPNTKIVTGTIGGTSGNILSGLSFSGKVAFNGEVVVPNLSFKITGITSGTPGYTFGSVIRLTNINGYTLARANNPDNAEAIGVISARNSIYSVVSVLGQIKGDFTGVAGRTLNAGCIYFLDPSTPGGITTNEPITVGEVSKPVIMGVSGDTALIVQYRGNYINGSLPSGMSGNNRIYVILPSASSSNGFIPGTFVSYLPNMGSYYTEFQTYITNTGRTLYDGWFISNANSSQIPSPGIQEEDFVVGMIETSETVGGNKVYQVVTKGASEAVPTSISPGTVGWWNLKPDNGNVSGTQLLLSSNNNTDSQSEKLYVGYNYNSTSFIVDIKPIIRTINSVASIPSPPRLLSSSRNETFNGDFSIWQRSTGRDSQYTDNITSKIYFADQWVRRTSRTGALTSQYVQRQSFSKTQTLVEGSPEYYVDVKCLYTPGSSWFDGHYSIGHILPNIETLANKNITVSFYAKCSNSNYSSKVYFARYNGTTQVSKATIGTVSLNTTWTKYTLTYTVPSLSAGSYSNDYVEIGFDLEPLVKKAYDDSVGIGTNLFASFASLCVYDDFYISPKHNFEPIDDKEYKAKRFYYTTYTQTQTEKTSTLTSSGEIALNASWLEYSPIATFKYEKLPTKMRKAPTVTLYSPSTGAQNDAFNATANLDLRQTTGTIGVGRKTRIAPLNSQTISTLSDESTVKINVLSGAVPYDVISYHLTADSSYPL